MRRSLIAGLYLSPLILLLLSASCAMPPAADYQQGDQNQSLNQVNDAGGLAVPRGIVIGSGGTGGSTGSTGSSTGSNTWPFTNSYVANSQTSAGGYPNYVFGNNQSRTFYAGPVRQLYRALVAIEPVVDPNQSSSAGPLYFIRALAAGMPWSNIIHQFNDSPYAQSYHNVAAMQNINALNRTMFGVVGDPSTMYQWVLKIGQGTTLAQVSETFYQSQQHQSIGANTFYVTAFVEWYRAILGRMPTQAELTSSMTAVINGTTSYDEWIDSLRSSQEAQSLGGTNAENVIAIYRLLLGGLPPSSEFSYWTQQGQSTTSVDSNGYSGFLQEVAQTILYRMNNGYYNGVTLQ